MKYKRNKRSIGHIGRLFLILKIYTIQIKKDGDISGGHIRWRIKDECI